MSRRSPAALVLLLALACGRKEAESPDGGSGTTGAGASSGGAGGSAGMAGGGLPGAGTSAGGAVGSAGSIAMAGSAGSGTAPINDGPGAVFVHLFEWKWTDIAAECESFLGPNGFAAVQVSPPSEHAVLGTYNYPWWQRYQTVAYGLDKSRSGTKAEFADMVARCKAAGVGIYVDTVINHMTAQASGTGSNGTSYTKYEYPGHYTAADFHQPPCAIQGSDYASNASAVQTCELVGLSDLNTSNPSVQQRIADYLTSLLAMGVRGFRIDAAKHMAPAEVSAIIGLVDASVSDEPPYYFLEVIDYGGEAIQATQYLDVGAGATAEIDVTEFRFTRVSDAFLNAGGANLASLADMTTAQSLPSDRAVVFTNNHDTQRGAAIYYADGAAYDLANVYLLASPYGYPQLMSSFAFDRSVGVGRDQGPPSDAMGNTGSIYDGNGQPAGCAAVPAQATSGSWVCEHRTPSLVKMMAFRKAVAGAADITNFWTNGTNQIAFGRGALGFVVINREESALTQTFQTSLPAGTYCDVLGPDACGTMVSVDGAGMASITVAAMSAAAFYVGASP
jgi:alpha-amylase